MGRSGFGYSWGGAIAFIFVVCAIFGVTAQDGKSAIQAAKSAILMHGPTALLLLVISLGLVMIGKVIRRFRRDIPLSEISETQKESNTRGSGEATVDRVASASPHRVYYVKRGSAVRGPFSLKKIRALDSAKKLKSNDELSRNGDGPWVRYATVYQDVRDGKAPKLLSDSDTSSERGSGDIG
jgi:hypothetical protein